MRQTERGGTERTGQLGAFLLALALLLVLTVFAHRVVLGLAAVIAGPLPAAQTALSLSRKAMQETVPDETPGSIASEPAPESAPEAAARAYRPCAEAAAPPEYAAAAGYALLPSSASGFSLHLFIPPNYMCIFAMPVFPRPS